MSTTNVNVLMNERIKAAQERWALVMQKSIAREYKEIPEAEMSLEEFRQAWPIMNHAITNPEVVIVPISKDGKEYAIKKIRFHLDIGGYLDLDPKKKNAFMEGDVLDLSSLRFGTEIAQDGKENNYVKGDII